MKWRILSLVCLFAPILAIYGVLFYDAWQSGKLINFLIIILIIVVACLWVWLSFWLCQKAGQEKERPDVEGGGGGGGGDEAAGGALQEEKR